jgi:hypothetical protein
MPSRLAFIVPFPYLPTRSGGQAAAAGFAQFLGRTAALTVLSTPGNSATDNANYELLPLLRRSALRYVDLRQLAPIGRALRERNVERIIVQQHFAAPLFWLLARRYGMRLEVWSHNLEYRRFRTMGRWFWPLVWLTEWLGYFLADRVYFISPDEIATARRVFGLAKAKCLPLPYGTPLQQPPANYAASRRRTREELGLPDDCLAICFFGALAYGPNAQALDYILSEILPELDRLNHFNYRLLIGGKGLDTQRPELANERITYLGFIPDLPAFCAAADLLLNPVATGAGVKTKVIDAIAAGLTVISSAEGALGVSPEVCGARLEIVAQHDPIQYAQTILRVRKAGAQQTPDSFYRYYHWGVIVQRLYL